MKFLQFLMDRILKDFEMILREHTQYFSFYNPHPRSLYFKRGVVCSILRIWEIEGWENQNLNQITWFEIGVKQIRSATIMKMNASRSPLQKGNFEKKVIE